MPRRFLLLVLAPLVLLAACDSADPAPAEPLPTITSVEVFAQGINQAGLPIGPEQRVRFVLQGEFFVVETVGNRFLLVEGREYEGGITFFGEVDGEPVEVMDTLRRNRERIKITYQPASAIANALFFFPDRDAFNQPVGLSYDLQVQRVAQLREGIVRLQFVQYRDAADKQAGAAPIGQLPTILLPVAVQNVDGL